MPIDKQWLVNLSGKLYPTYPGVLDAAWKDGLAEIQVELLQQPTPDNGETAVCRATVVIEREGRRLVFSDIGDASPKNVNSRIATALIRMASTRAKGRALRDSINCGDTLLEELPQEEEKPGRVSRATPRADTQEPPPNTAPSADLVKVRQRYDDIRAERIALGLSDPGPWKPAWSPQEVRQQATTIFQDVAKKRKSMEIPVEDRVGTPTAPTPPPAKESEAKRRLELLAAWEQITKIAAGYGLTWNELSRNPTIAILESRGKALAETVAQVQADYESLDEMQDEVAEFGIEYDPGSIDRTKTDPYALRKLVDRLSERLDEAKNNPPPDLDVDPFSEE